MATTTDPSTLGVAGFLLRSAPDVGTALRDLVHHLDLHDRGAVLTLVTNGRVTSLGYTIHLSKVEAADQIYDLAMTVACKILRGLCGTSWSPTEVSLSPYRRIFRARLQFDAHRSALAFPTRWLDHPIATSDPLLHRHLEIEAKDLAAERQQHLVGKLRRLLLISLPLNNTGAGAVARELGMHQRTLNRRLRDEGTTFRQELEYIRYELARRWLAETDMPLSKISAALDYADATAFSRAFKRWSGASPTEWRRLHRRSDRA